MSEAEKNIQNIAKMRAEHKEKVNALKKKRFTKMVTNVLLLFILLTAAGVGMSSVGYIQVFGFVIIAMLPALAALVTDRRPGRFASKTVFALNLTGISPHLASIIFSGSPNQTAIALIQDVDNWFLIYGFAGLGWAMVFILPYIAELYIEVKSVYTIKRLNQFKDSLVDEWGDGVSK